MGRCSPLLAGMDPFISAARGVMNYYREMAARYSTRITIKPASKECRNSTACLTAPRALAIAGVPAGVLGPDASTSVTSDLGRRTALTSTRWSIGSRRARCRARSLDRARGRRRLPSRARCAPIRRQHNRRHRRLPRGCQLGLRGRSRDARECLPPTCSFATEHEVHGNLDFSGSGVRAERVAAHATADGDNWPAPMTVESDGGPGPRLRYRVRAEASVRNCGRQKL